VLTNSNEKSGAIPQKKTFRIPQIFKRIFSETNFPGSINLALRILGDLGIFKLTGEALSVTELTAFPQNGPPPQIHQREDESFWVLDGEFSFLLSEKPFNRIHYSGGGLLRCLYDSTSSASVMARPTTLK
jgi:hypothetical protein